MSALENKDDTINELAEELFPVLIKNIVKGNLLKALKADLPCDVKKKIYLDLKTVCKDLVTCYKNHEYSLMLSSMEKLTDLNNYSKKILKWKENGFD